MPGDEAMPAGLLHSGKKRMRYPAKKKKLN